MIIHVPKYKELYIKDGHMSMSSGIRGEYRAILRDSSGSIKHDSDWRENTVLNNGLYAIVAHTGPSYIRPWWYESIRIGTSDTPVDFSQDGLLGTELASVSINAPISVSNSGSPNYVASAVSEGVYASGVGTGLVKEFAIYGNSAAVTYGHAAIRVVLTTPINKGAGDHLTIQHKMYWYPQLSDVTGTIDISGTPYNFTMRHTKVNVAERIRGLVPSAGGTNIGDPGFNRLYLGNLGTIIQTPIDAGAVGYAQANNVYCTTAGSSPNYYCSAECIWNVDTPSSSPVSYNILFTGYMGTNPLSNRGVQIKFTKVSDGSPLIKLNTHELRLNWRSYSIRYVP